MTGSQQRRRQRQAYQAVVTTFGARKELGVPVRDTFFRRDGDGKRKYPLAHLMSSRSGPGGGRGGRTRLALYLSLLWVAAGRSHSSQRPASFWASLLGIPDPDNAGARVIRSTWAELASRKLVHITPGARSGDIPIVHSLREDGSGEAYSIPTGHSGDTYRRIPQNTWKLLIPEHELTGAGLAMYLIAVRTALQAQSPHDLTFPAASFKTQYGLSDTTRKAGLANLTDLLVLEKTLRSTDTTGGYGGRRHQRSTYDIDERYAPQVQAAQATKG